MRFIYKVYYKILFKIKKPKKIINHPRFDKPIEFSFEVEGKYYYKLKNDYDIFENRFRYMKTFYQEVENKLTSKDINEFCDAIVKYINDDKKVQAGQLADEMKYRSTWLFEPTSLYKFASVIYFDLDEDIRDYEVDYCHKKIKYWSKKKVLLRMLLKSLMTGVGSLLDLSNNDFNNYISELQRAKEKQQKLISDAGLTTNKNQIEVTT